MSTKLYAQPQAVKRAMNKLSDSAAQVIFMRLAFLPLQWMTDPVGAEKETKKMFSEKHDALIETQIALATLPIAIWTDFLSTGMFSTPKQVFNRASTVATRELFKPAQSRVSGNVKRLGNRKSKSK